MHIQHKVHKGEGKGLHMIISEVSKCDRARGLDYVYPIEQTQRQLT